MLKYLKTGEKKLAPSAGSVTGSVKTKRGSVEPPLSFFLPCIYITNAGLSSQTAGEAD
jgi:hypothetical protein